ncbi:helix-turn-helix transcriptional regulator [Agrobacterium tumefaciens]|jgi:predicted DNA-binding transcriptional regulator AlpA|uniref:helix-turn-helix transcriptional regulator n=1 Tax=Agrobacterium tumefaciens TaxID=358 RepID=UPI000E0B8CD6|nr:helix-turn-helix domain-containing protein [Agrobacterium tumefaciens]
MRLNTIEASAYLGMSPSWLNKTRLNGTGPVYMKTGGRVQYETSDLDDWLRSSRRTAVYDFANDSGRARAAA